MTEELNRRHNLATMPTINNNGESYIVPFDIYKEGYDAYDISNWFKGRVGDNGTPFGIRWYKHGQLMDVTGMRPFIEGQVGDYTIDDSDPDDPKINMDSEASNVHVVGEVNDCQEYGVAIYRLINQAMPQSGIFYGKIGVMGTQDDGTTVMSSVDVVFKVLAGHMNMIGARKFYVSELEKALIEFQAKTKKHDQDYATLVEQHNQEFHDQAKRFNDDTQKVIDDARSTYESETKNAHDNLLALQSQIAANRDEQATLAQHLAGTEQQIEIHDVVTRPEFLDLGNRLNQQVANLRQNKTLYFQNLDELQSKYPNGTDNLCITLNDKHLHVYDYANNKWTDAGATDVITADPQTKDAIYQDSSNLAPDPDFKIITDSWFFGRDMGAADWALENKKIDNSNIIKMNGYYSESNTNNWNNSWIISKPLNVTGANSVSISWMINAKYGQQPNDANVQLQLTFYDANKARITAWSYKVPPTNGDALQFFKWGNIYDWPAGTCYIAASIQVHGNGTVEFAQPRINLGSRDLPYDIREVMERVGDFSDHKQLIDATPDINNLIPNPELTNLDLWIFGSDLNKSRIEKQKRMINNASVYRMYGHNQNGAGDYGNAWLTSTPFPVSGSTISLSSLLSIHLDDPSSGYVSIGIIYLRADGSKSAPDYSTNINTNTIGNDLQRYSWENKLIPNEDTAKIQFVLEIHGSGYVDVAYPIANLEKTITDNRKVMFFQRPNHEATDLWSFGKDLGGPVPYQINDVDKTLSFDGFHSDVTDNNYNNTWLMANKIFFDNKDYYCISLDFLMDIKLTGDPADNYIRLDFQAHDGVGSQQVYRSSRRFTADDLVKGHLYWDGLPLPKGCQNFGIGITLHDKGTITIKDFNYKFNSVYQDDGLPIMFVNQSTAAVENNSWSKADFTFVNGKTTTNGYMQIGVQGDSSKNYPKKNYKIKLFSDDAYKKKLKFAPKAGWTKNSKFNLKANWIDATQARNLVNAKMVEKATAITPMSNLQETGDLLNTQSLGQIEGFPIEIYFQDGYHGLYTFNTKKDDKTFGMDSDNVKHEVISSEVADHEFYDSNATIDGKLYASEIHDTVTDEVKGNFEKLIKFIINSTDDDFVKNLGNYIDINSIINTMLYGILSHEWDYASKSFLLLTWNGGSYWYMIPYDLDSTWGLFWNGSKVEKEGEDHGFGFKIVPGDSTSMKWVTAQDNNHLYNRIYMLMRSQIKKQYDYLRSHVWDNASIIKEFKNFINSIPASAYKRDKEYWKTIPSADTTGLAQLQQMIIERGNDMDSFMQDFDKNPTDAEQYIPVPKTVTAALGQRPNANALIDKTNLPAGTNVVWDKYPDDKVGTQAGRVTIVYPDGSSSKVDVNVTYTQATTPAN